jgi:hypothetical protein
MLLDGDPDQGKSLLILDLVARLTTARPLPEAPALPVPLSVVLIGNEDGLYDTVLPRLLAAGADLGRVHAFVGCSLDGTHQGPPLFPEDCDLLRETLHETGARLVVIDPLEAVLGTAVGLNGAQVRRALGPLAQIAEETRTAMILVRHLNKGGRGQRALYRGSGSIALIGVARTAFVVGAHPTDDQWHVLACTKSNLTERPAALGFRIGSAGAEHSVVTWTGPVDISADDLVLAPGRPPGEALRQARDFLEALLREGPCRAEDAFQLAQAAGISRRTLERAKAELPVESTIVVEADKKHWTWRLNPVSSGPDPLPSPEAHQRAIDEAQKECDELLARLREKYGQKPVASSQ